MKQAGSTPLRDFQTARLVVSDWTPKVGDPALHAALPDLLTPQVTRYLPPGFAPGATIVEWIEARRASGEVYTVTHAADDRLVGLAFMGRGPDGLWRLGYLLHPDTWGKGLATELVRGMLANTTESTGPILAGVVVDNPASVAVLIKAGFAEIDSSDTGLRMFRFDPV